MKKYLTTIIKYAFSILMILLCLKTTKDFKYVLVSLLELTAIFALSDFLISKNKLFNILNDILMLIFNAELCVLLFGSSYISFVMLQSLNSLEDLQGKVVVYAIGVIAVLACSFLPVCHVEKLKKYPIMAFPVLLVADILLLFNSSVAFSPYAGAKELYVQWNDYREMKQMIEEYKKDYEELATKEDEYDEDYEELSDSSVLSDSENNSFSVNIDSKTDNSAKSNNSAKTDNSANEDNGKAEDLVEELDELKEESDLSDNNAEDNQYMAETVMSDSNAAKANDLVCKDITKTDNLSNNSAANTSADSNTNKTSEKKTGIEAKISKMYPAEADIAHSNLPAGTNVIVIFVEGLSNNIITDSRAIMPNLQAFSHETISFSNYYNHTFATYRGIQGQLYSGYSLEDYETNHLPSVMDVLKQNGYTTAFINVEPSNTDFTNYLNAMSFDYVDSDLGAGNSLAGSLSDRQAYEKLFKMAEEYQAKGKPFFLGLYSFGTHVSFNSDDQQYGDGTNSFLNRYYNCDYHLGAFIDSFKNSSLANNTMLVITADHSCYADEDFVKTFPEYKRNHGSCDKIPLYIYYKGLNTSINASGRNSLDLAPTILDLLGYDIPSSFMGSSLYSGKNSKTILDTFFWNPDGCSYTGDCIITNPDKEIKDYVCTEVIKYVSAK